MNKLGIIGEKIAIRYLKRHGYKIFETNFRVKCGELDIIAKRGEYICFIEVKTRSSSVFAQPFEGVDYFKQIKLKKCAEIWLCMHGLSDVLCRFDVVSILLEKNGSLEEIRLFQDAFWT